MILTDGTYLHKLTVLSFWYSQGMRRNQIQQLFQMTFQTFFQNQKFIAGLKS